MEKKYGWFSPEMAFRVGSVIWESVDGDNVELTAVSIEPEHGLGYTDVKFVAMVRRCVEGNMRNAHIHHT